MEPIISQEILDEYRSVVDELSAQYPAIDTIPILEYVAKNTKLIIAPILPEPVCTDPDDDKFIACAIAAHCEIIVSGDKHLLNVSGYCGLQVLKPREFVDKFLATALPAAKFSIRAEFASGRPDLKAPKKVPR